MLEVMQYDEIKKYKKYVPLDLNNNSKLYYDKDIIYKIPYSINLDFENILKYIDMLNIDELIELKNLIYNGDTLVGYSFINYKKYKSLRRSKKRNLELKKQDCIKIIKAYDVLSKNNLKYSDFHLGNILLNNKTNSIKICDLDGISLVKDEELNKKQLKRAVIISLAYLYNINYYDVRNVVEAEGIKNSNSFINICIKYIDDINVDDALNLLSEFESKYLYIDRKEIIEKSKELSDKGYYKYRRF